MDCQQHKLHKTKQMCEVLAFNIGSRSSSSVIWHITVVQSKAGRITTTKTEAEALHISDLTLVLSGKNIFDESILNFRKEDLITLKHSVIAIYVAVHQKFLSFSEAHSLFY